MTMEFPIFDLSEFEKSTGSERARKAAEIDEICRRSGFLAIKGHGVPRDVIDAIWVQVSGFFAQCAEAKSAVRAPKPGYPYGHLGPLSEALAASTGEITPPDLKESFNGGPLGIPEGMTDPEALAFCYAPTLWPDLSGFREAWEAYYVAMEDLAARIMESFAAALGLREDHFAPYIDAPISALRALHYPATKGAAEDGQQRAGAHTDYGSLTILLPQVGSRGLQLKDPQGEWQDVPAMRDTFVINIGDLMARWTSDRWVSTLHRVVAIPDQPARQSLAFFHQPNWEAKITPLDGSDTYPPVRSGPYLMDKFKSTSA
jgi:isopenicillin N synthase-like dioxygenase